jgi:hypothetical protein
MSLCIIWVSKSKTNYMVAQKMSLCIIWVSKNQRRIVWWFKKLSQWFATGRWFSLGPPVSSTKKIKTDRQDKTEILLKVVLNTIKPNQTQLYIERPLWITTQFYFDFYLLKLCIDTFWVTIYFFFDLLIQIIHRDKALIAQVVVNHAIRTRPWRPLV